MARSAGALGLAAGLVLAAAVGPVLSSSGGLELEVRSAAGGQPLAGATVELDSNRGYLARTAHVADAQGRVSFPVLRAGGGYSVEVSMPGFAKRRVGDLRVTSGQTKRIVIQLTTATEERVVVTATTEIVDLERTGSSTRFSDELLGDLPVPGRFYQNVLTLAPGVNDGDEDGNPNVHGARERDFKAMVSGVSNVDPLTGYWLNFIHPESIEDMEVITSGAGVEFGRAQGGFARILQKQGSNEFEGVFSFTYRSSRFDGAGASSLPSDLTPSFRWRQPSVQVSGPVVKDKLWFRLSHERMTGEDPQNLNGRVEVSPREQRIIADQLTWQASPRNKLAFQYQKSRSKIDNFGMTSTILPESTYSIERASPTYQMVWTAPYSSKILVESMVAWQDGGETITPMTTGLPQNCLVFWEFYYLNWSHCLNLNDGVTSGSFPERYDDDRQRLTVRSDATVFQGRWLGVSHRFKFGFIVEDEDFQRRLQREPDVRFNVEQQWVSPCPTNPEDEEDGCFQNVGFVSALTSVPEDSVGQAEGSTWGLYFEDQIRPMSNLTLTAGLRLEREEINATGKIPFDPASEAETFLGLLGGNVQPGAMAARAFTAYADIDGFQAQLIEDLQVWPDYAQLGSTARQSKFWFKKQAAGNVALRNTNLAPRLALAWDPWKNGKTKFAFSVGRYYDKIPLAATLVEVEPPQTTLVWQASNWQSDVHIARLLLNGINPGASARALDRDLATPYQDEWSLSFERSLWPETAVSVTYLRRKFEDQLQDIDINHAPADHGKCRDADGLGDHSTAASPGAGQILVDIHTGEEYVDTDSGDGDGRTDDCSGNVIVVNRADSPWIPARTTVTPDGLLDPYVLNPGWGEILLLGNFNTSEYEALILEFIRRQYRNWELQASYTWSDAKGDAEDFNQLLGNERNLREDEYGYLAYDQRHVVRVTATSVVPGAFRLGGTVRWQSGLPFSELDARLTSYSIPPDYENLGDVEGRLRQRYPTGQRNDQRNPSYWNVDVRVAKDFRLYKSVQMQLNAEIFNLLDDDTWLVESRTRGFISGQRRFGRRFQFGVRLSF